MHITAVPPEVLDKVLAYVPITTLLQLPSVSKLLQLATRHRLIAHFLQHLHVHVKLATDIKDTDELLAVLRKHAIPKLRAVCPVTVEAKRKVKKSLFDLYGDEDELEGVDDVDAFFDSLEEEDERLCEHGAGQSIEYYQDYIAIDGYEGPQNELGDMVWTLYPRRDGDWVVFECLESVVVPFGIGMESVKIRIAGCLQPKGCAGTYWDGGCARFTIVPWHNLSLGNTGAKKNSSSEDEDEEEEEDEDEDEYEGEGGDVRKDEDGDEEEEEDKDGGWGENDVSEDDVSKDDAESPNSTLPIPDSAGNVTLDNDRYSVTYHVQHHVYTTEYDNKISEISVASIRIPLSRFGRLGIRALRRRYRNQELNKVRREKGVQDA
ncbi:hypothetical protein HK104_009425 [Borealophlyctis nickersoniae]|nr:hypothetical protein HK104_009425 [Borealophlyctis nickersoniae]